MSGGLISAVSWGWVATAALPSTTEKMRISATAAVLMLLDHDADGHGIDASTTSYHCNDILTMFSAHNKASLISTMPLKRGALQCCQVLCQLRRAEHVLMSWLTDAGAAADV